MNWSSIARNTSVDRNTVNWSSIARNTSLDRNIMNWSSIAWKTSVDRNTVNWSSMATCRNENNHDRLKRCKNLCYYIGIYPEYYQLEEICLYVCMRAGYKFYAMV